MARGRFAWAPAEMTIGSKRQCAMKLLDVKNREAWRKWLAKNHAKEREIWLVFHKKHTEVSRLNYDESVEDALCFGWIDSIIKRLDEQRYARKFTPRNPGSRWSQLNKVRAERMIKQRRMTKAGLALINQAKSTGEWDSKNARPRVALDEIPQELRSALAGNSKAAKAFRALAPSYQKLYVVWVGFAKKVETRQRRAREAIQKLERGERLGLK
jgi:uncharacterized protein YdeI (YjbR/CyaY-like superfamily)